MFRIICATIAICLPIIAHGQTKGLHEALEDCVTAVTTGAYTFAQADVVEGDAVSGFVAWYNGLDGDPIYAARLGIDGDVKICSGPEPMGPFLGTYEDVDKLSVETAMRDRGLTRLNVPAAGDYYANCEAEAPMYFLALNTDPTQRVGWKFISSRDVAGTCEKFGG